MFNEVENAAKIIQLTELLEPIDKKINKLEDEIDDKTQKLNELKCKKETIEMSIIHINDKNN